MLLKRRCLLDFGSMKVANEEAQFLRRQAGIQCYCITTSLSALRFRHQSTTLLTMISLLFYTRPLSLLLLHVTSVPHAAASSAVCSQFPYDVLLPLSNYAPAEAFCTSFLPPHKCTTTVPVTNVLTSTIVVSTTVATIPSTISKCLLFSCSILGLTNYRHSYPDHHFEHSHNHCHRWRFEL